MRLANLLLKMQKQEAKKCTRNEGSSGDVDENKEWPKVERETDVPEPVNASTRGNGQTVRDARSEVQSPRFEAANAEDEVTGPQSRVARTASGVGNDRPAVIKQAGACGRMPETEFRSRKERGVEVGKVGVEANSGRSAEVQQPTA
jgi:hypothetical protein